VALKQQNNAGGPDGCASRANAAHIPKVSRDAIAEFRDRLFEGNISSQVSRFVTKEDVARWKEGKNRNSEENRLRVELHQKYKRCEELRTEKIDLLTKRNENEREIACDESEIVNVRHRIADTTKKLDSKKGFLECGGEKIANYEERLTELFARIDATAMSHDETEKKITEVSNAFAPLKDGKEMIEVCEELRGLFGMTHMVKNYRDKMNFGRARFIDNITSVAKVLEGIGGLVGGALSETVKENTMNMSTLDFLMLFHSQEEGRMIIIGALEGTRKKEMDTIKLLETLIKKKYTETITDLEKIEQLALKQNKIIRQLMAEIQLSKASILEIENEQEMNRLMMNMVSECKRGVLQARTHIGELINLETAYLKALNDANQTLEEVADLEHKLKLAQFAATELSNNKISDRLIKRGEIADRIAKIDKEVSIEEEMIADVSERLAKIKKKKDDVAEKQLAREERKEWNNEYFRAYGVPAPRDGDILPPKTEVKVEEEQKGRKIGEVLEMWAEIALLNFNESNEILATHPQQRENLKNTIMRLGRIYLSERKITYQTLIREFPTRIKVERVVDEDARLYRIGIESKNEYRIYLNIGKMNNGNGSIDLQRQPLIMYAAIKLNFAI